MRLIHTLLLYIRPENEVEDIKLLAQCLTSLEKSTFKTVIIYNQGFWDYNRIKAFVSNFHLDCIIIGDAENVGIVQGRQACFQYIWANHPGTEFISELHLDMIFTKHWEDPLIDFLDSNDEPVVGCGIVNRKEELVYTGKTAGPLPANPDEMDAYFYSLRSDTIIDGFVHPCIHKSSILKEIGGFDTRFLTGKHCFEDDSCLLGYFYYYGTKANWRPKMCCRSVVYHATEKQRYSTGETIWVNFDGLLRQYGLMGILQLSKIHEFSCSKEFFMQEFQRRVHWF